MTDKNKTLPELADIVIRLKKEGKKSVLCSGCFDVLHPGHTQHFRDAKSQGDVLIVAITSDRYVKQRKGGNRPYWTQDIRANELAEREIIDYVVIVDYPTTLDAINVIKPDIWAKGSDYKPENHIGGNFPKEKELVESYGGKVYFTGGFHYSSTKVINDLLQCKRLET